MDCLEPCGNGDDGHCCPIPDATAFKVAHYHRSNRVPSGPPRCYSESLNMQLAFSAIVSVVSLVVSVTVGWLTLFRRGTLRMTQPVQVAFLYENGTKPKIFLRTLLYATGKRGYVIEGLYLKVKEPDSSRKTFGFWGYGERDALMVAGGLRVTEEGVAYNHHFLQISDTSYFPEGRYEIEVYARLVNRKKPKLLMTIGVALTDQEATRLHLQRGVLFTWNPDTRSYDPSFDMPKRDSSRQSAS